MSVSGVAPEHIINRFFIFIFGLNLICITNFYALSLVTAFFNKNENNTMALEKPSQYELNEILICLLKDDVVALLLENIRVEMRSLVA